MINNGKVSPPIGLFEMARLLGCGQDAGQICTSPHINKWSKYKPISSNNPGLRISTDKLNVYNPITNKIESVPAWYGQVTQETKTVSGLSVQLTKLCGISIPEVFFNRYSDVCDLMDGYETNGLNWPPESITGCGRIADFEGYDHYAVSPFYFSASQEIYYANEYPMFSYTTYSESSNSLGLSDIEAYFQGYRYAVLIRSISSGTIYIIMGESLDAPGLESGILRYESNLNTGDYRAYFVLINEEKERVILLPHQDGVCNNPIPFRVERNIANPETNPLLKLGVDLFSRAWFGFETTSPYLESMQNVGENEYAYLCTTGSYYLELELINSSSSAINVDLNEIWVEWSAFQVREAGGNSRNSRPSCAFFLDGTPAGGTISIPANSSHRLGIHMPDIYYDPDTGSTLNKIQGQSYGEIDPAVLRYNNAIIGNFYIMVIYDPAHNGYFYSGMRGYYKSK